jgi:LPS-assembly lipoprotein
VSAGRRLLLLAPFALALAGCGFHPLYGEEGIGAGDPTLASIKVLPIAEHSGQLLREELRLAFNPDDRTAETHYELHVTLQVVRTDLGITRGATAASGRVTISANYILTDIRSNARAFSGVSRGIAEYNIVDDGYATFVAFEAAEKRAIEDLGREISFRVANFAAQHRAQGPG